VAEPDPSFFARIALALAALFRVLFDASYAGRVARLGRGEPAPAPTKAPEPKPPEVPVLRETNTDGALQLLGLLQREGRLIDFLQEEVAAFSDAEVGAAARVVHESTRKALFAHVTLARVRSEAEGTRVRVEKGFRAQDIRLVGNVIGEAPFSGLLNHAGWRAESITLPKLSEGHDVRVLQAAEVEL
jgi:hypothetical protein